MTRTKYKCCVLHRDKWRDPRLTPQIVLRSLVRTVEIPFIQYALRNATVMVSDAFRHSHHLRAGHLSARPFTSAIALAHNNHLTLPKAYDA